MAELLYDPNWNWQKYVKTPDEAEKIANRLGRTIIDPAEKAALENPGPAPASAPDVMIPYAPPKPNAVVGTEIPGATPLAPSPEAQVAPIAPEKPAPSPYAGVDNAMAGIRQGVDLQTKAQLDQAKIEADKMENILKMQEDYKLKAEARDAERKSLLDKRMGEIDAAIAESANYKYEDFWADKSVGQKIASAISLGLGQFGAAMTGGQNIAADILKQAMNEHIAKEKARYDAGVDKIGQKKSAYAVLKEKLGDDAAVASALNEMGMKMIAAKADMLAARSSDPKIKAANKLLLGQLELGVAQDREKRADEISKASAKAQAEGQKDNRERFVPGLNLLALTKEDATEVKKNYFETKNATDTLKELQRMANDRTLKASPAARARAQTLVNMLIGGLRTKIVGPGAFSEKEVELMKDIVADPTKLWSWGSVAPSITKARINAVVDKVEGDFVNEVFSRTGEKVSRQSVFGTPDKKTQKLKSVVSAD